MNRSYIDWDYLRFNVESIFGEHRDWSRAWFVGLAATSGFMTSAWDRLHTDLVMLMPVVLVLSLFCLNLCLGTWIALRAKKFDSHRFGQAFQKLIVYAAVFFLTFVLEEAGQGIKIMGFNVMVFFAFFLRGGMMLQEVTSVLENLLPYIDTHSSLYKLINGFAVKGRQLMTTWSEVSPRLDSQDKTLRAQNVILLEQSKALTEASERIHELEERQEQLVQDTLKQTGRRGLRVLAIDDNPLALVMLTNVFEQYGHHVVGTSDPTKVIELALDNPPQLILCDLMQPELKDGIRIAYDIKHTATLSHIPLVALTALDLVILGTNEDFILSRSLFAGIVPKPETLNDFQLLIVNALSFIPLCEA